MYAIYSLMFIDGGGLCLVSAVTDAVHAHSSIQGSCVRLSQEFMAEFGGQAGVTFCFSGSCQHAFHKPVVWVSLA